MPTSTPESVTLLIPCETFAVKAVLVPSESLTALERLVLRALHAGATTIDTLNDLFAIGHRPMMRLVLDFLDRALVTCNFETGEIRVTPPVVELIKTNRLDEIEAGGRTEEQFELMRDLVAGTILRRRRQPAMKPHTRVTSILPPNSSATLAAEEIALAIRTLVRRRLSHRSDRPRHVAEMAVDYSGGRTRDLEVEVKPVLDDVTDRLTVHIEGPDDLPSRTRAGLEKTLTELANVEHPQNVFNVLRQKAIKREDTAPPGLHARIRELRKQFDDLKTADPGTYESRQAKMRDLAVTLDDMIRRAANVTAEAITDPGRHAEAAAEIISGAQSQVVIACPSAQRAATMQFRSAIENAAAKGRRLFFLFGRRDDDMDVEPSVMTWLDGVRRGHPDRVFFVDAVSARCNGRFIVADGGDALVSSSEFLHQHVHDMKVTTAVRLTARSSSDRAGEQRLVAMAALDLLAAAKTIYPDPEGAEELLDSWFRFGTFGPSALADVPLPTMPRTRDDDPYGPQRILLWMREWERRIAQTEAEGVRLLATHELVRNDEHDQWLQNALRSAERRLLIVSRVISDSAVQRRFVDDLKSCLNRPEMRVAMFYQKIDASALRELQALRAVYGERFQLVQWDLGRTAVRLLVCDDWCVIGGLDFLAIRASRRGADKYRVPAEVGVRLDGAAIVEDLLADLTPAMPPLARWKGVESPAPPPPPAVLPSLRRPIVALLDRIEEDLGNGERIADAQARARRIGSLLRSWFENASTPEEAYAELAELDAIQVPFIEQAVAVCLDIHRLGPDHPHTKQYFRRIIEERWRRSDFAGAYFILAAAPRLDARSVPSPGVAMLAARVSAGSATEELFDEVVKSESDPASSLGLAALGLPMVLLEKVNPAQAMHDLRDALPVPLQKWAAAIVDFRAHHPSGLDLGDVAEMSKSRSGIDRRRRAREVLEVELRRCVGLRFDFTFGSLVWAHLVKRPLGFQDLLHAVEKDDLQTFREFVQRYARYNAEDMLDEATDHSTRTRDRIDGDHRRLCLTRIGNVLREARIWTLQTDTVTPAAMQAQITALARRLAGDLRAVEDLNAGLGDAFPSVLLSALRAKFSPVLELAS